MDGRRILAERTGTTAPPARLGAQIRDTLGLFRSSGFGRRAALLVAALVGVIGLTAYMQIRLNAWNEPFYDALTRKDMAAFVAQLGVFAALAGVLLVLNVSQLWLDQTMKLTLRRGLFRALVRDWMAPGRALRLSRAGKIGENPDQRLQADVDQLADLSAALGIGLFQATLLLGSFIGVLWQKSEGFTLSFGGQSHEIPGFMVWCALFYAVAASWLSWRVGRPLVALRAEESAREAVLRFDLVRISEAAGRIALERGERAETSRIETSFAGVVGIVEAVILATANLTWVTAGYGWFTLVAPILVAAPFYFTSDMSIGELMMVAGAFTQVQGSLRWFVSNFAVIATWRATLFRVTSFHRAVLAVDRAEAAAEAAGPRIDRREDAGRIEIAGLHVVTPQVGVRLAPPEVIVGPGERVLLHGGSGSGKTLLFDTLAGLWTRAEGHIAMPPPDRVMYLPTRAYVPPGRLDLALCYPEPAERYGHDQMVAALDAVGLGHLSAALGESGRWDQLLGQSDKQCLVFARALLRCPDWLVMDDVLDQLDPEALTRIEALLQGRLARLGVLGIGDGATPSPVFGRVVQIVAEPGSARHGAGTAAP
ncbi:hypothetical protein BV509_10075 [Rhodovulum sulfidophilum]|nr:hypothetical protein BV509_10075 [Rhodovulum sulfidophilum]